MKLKTKERTFFENNPVKEVIAQIRFPESFEIQDSLPVAFQKEIAKDFPHMEVQEGNAVSFKLGSTPEGDQIVRQKQSPIFNFISVDKSYRVSLSSSYVALTCSDYESWDDFLPKLKEVYQKVIKHYSSIPLITRVGLRYRNLIDKEELGIQDKKWEELIDPRIIGHLAHSGLFEGSIEEAELRGTNSMSQLKLDDFSLTLQTGFADNNGRFCFFIDADYYNEFSLTINDFDINKELEVLHGKSSSVFGNCILEPLHNALKPIPKS